MSPEMDGMTEQIDLPGFRFHPTEEELLDFYLRNMVYGKRLHLDVIGFLNIYRHDPKDLPGMAKIGEREWYFFVPRDRKHGSGGRPNRTTESGFWKATGSDRKILKSSDPKRVIGLRKTLVFYKGRAPRGCRTDWVMNEYRLPDNSPSPKEVVLCKIYRKATSLKVLEQRAAQEEAETKTHNNNNTPTPLLNFHAYSSSSSPPSMSMDQMVFEDTVKVKQEKHNATTMTGSSSSSSSLQLPFGLPELQVPKLSSDWNQLDPNWSLLNSPWLQSLTPTFYASLHSVSN